MIERRLASFASVLFSRGFHRCGSLSTFFEPSRQGKYLKEPETNPKDVLKHGIQEIPKEFKKLKKEVVDHMLSDQFYDRQHNDYEILWQFDTPESIESWMVTSDSDFSEGKSTAQFILNQNRKGVFFGNLNTEVPKDGILKAAGYCNIMSPTNELSFKRIISYDLSHYTHFITKVRGDGRVYNIICNMRRDWDFQCHDQYQFMLFTRGGPYWQIAKIPFSKFFLNSKGRVQDKQQPMQLDAIETIGITLGDANTGPFRLEIDFIGCINDASYTGVFDYEMYEVAPHTIE